MRTRFLITLSLIILGEVYSFILVRSVVKSFPSPWKTIAITTYFLLTAMTWGSFLLFRRIDWAHLPHYSRNLFVAFTIGFFIAKIFMAVIMLMDDVRRIVLWLTFLVVPAAKPKLLSTTANGISRSKFLKSLALIIGGTTVGGFIYGVTNRYRYQVRNIKLAFPNLPASFKGLKIVQISDIHSGSFDRHEAVAKGVEKVLEQKADIIFFTGDLVNNKAEEIVPYIDIFSKVKAPLGVYSTLGNHDYGDYVPWESVKAKHDNLETLKAIHGQMGWHLMMNEHVVVERGEDKIAVIGIENWGAKAGFPKYGDMRKAYHGLPEKNIPFQILLSHDPSHWDAQVITEYKDVDLTLSGHTHGMQFGIEIPGFKWSPVKYVYKNWAGLAQIGKQYLYVNRGYGFLGYPGRLGIMPEITVIELV
jgi:predicted MPP superfamily phosphohydrolase